ncbi:Stk1 family PASTA domain-containing Ser/Thr kinase [Sporosarcina sp. CAU 1771]
MIGRRIGGRYEIIKYIGGGGMSKVFLAHDVILDRDVAIKILNYDFSNEEELKRRFMREALSATSLTHPHIVDIFDVGEEDELHYLVMEYVEGQTLKEYIQTNGPLRPDQAVPIMRQLVSAISNAHYNGIIHRDIKPQNILMDVDGNLKITDFGIAMALSATSHTKTNSVLGTVHYLSPEQARGGMATMKSDIYSLGIVFYELLTGELPFSGESAVSIALKHLQEETPSVRALFPSIPQSVENIILKATTKDSGNRYRTADEMQEDLTTVLLPERVNESKFSIPFDDDKTVAIPAIIDSNRFENVADTKKIEPLATPSPEAVVDVPKKKKKWPIVVSIISGILLLSLILLMLPSILGPKKVDVPDVIDMEQAKAAELLEEEGFIVDEIIEQSSDEFEAGRVIRTDPEVGRTRDYGSLIKLFVSIGKETVEMESYLGENFAQVASLLANYGYNSIASPEEIFSDKPKGTIVSQSPEAGTTIIPSETDLVFQVSKGPDTLTLIDLQGYTKKQWEKYAKDIGLKISVLKEEYSSDFPKGEVISQQPQANSEVVKGDSVTLVVSRGPEKKASKHLYQTVTIEYVPEPIDPNNVDENGEVIEPENTPQNIRIYLKDKTHTMDDLFDEFMITETVTRSLTIELEEGQSGGYRIMRDAMQIAEESFDYKDIE